MGYCLISTEAQQLDENNKTHMSAFVNLLNELRNLGKFCIVVHHTKKDIKKGDNPFQNLAGHSDLERAIDGGVMLSRDSKEKGLIRVQFMARDFDTPEDKFAQIGSKGELILVDEEKIQRPESDEEKILKVLKKHAPKDKTQALMKKELTPLLISEEDFPLAEDTVEDKYPEWITKKWLMEGDKEGKAKTYYLAPKHH